MAVAIEYERLMKRAFSFQELDMVENTVSWYYAAIKAYNKDCRLSLEDLTMKASAHEIGLLKDAVMGAFAEWCAVPGIDDEVKQDAEDGGHH
jgi:hypothetical protein